MGDRTSFILLVVSIFVLTAFTWPQDQGGTDTQPAPDTTAAATQSVAPAPTASALAAKAIAALTNSVSISDVTLTASVTTTIGPDTKTATGTLSATAASQSRLDMTIGTGTTSEIRTVINGSPFGARIAQDGTQTSFGGQNCLTDAAWFFPAFTALAASADPNFAFSYVGTEQRAGGTVYHLRSYRDTSGFAVQWGLPQGSTLPPIFSTTDFYLDTTTFLPVALSFYTHLDQDATIDIPVEIDFSNYQAVNGIVVPFHIQKYLQGGLIWDFAVTKVVVNSGLPSSSFQIQ